MPLGANKAALFGMAGVSTGDVVLLETYTAGGEALKVFEGFSSDYKYLVWQFVNLHGSATDTDLTFRVKKSGGTYGLSTQSQAMRAYNRQDGTAYAVAYWPGADHLANGATDQIMLHQDLNFTSAEFSVNGYMTLYSPTSSVYYKNWVTRSVGNLQTGDDPVQGAFISGYVLEADALDGIEFKFDAPTANIDTGKILYWGVK